MTARTKNFWRVSNVELNRVFISTYHVGVWIVYQLLALIIRLYYKYKLICECWGLRVILNILEWSVRAPGVSGDLRRLLMLHSHSDHPVYFLYTDCSFQRGRLMDKVNISGWGEIHRQVASGQHSPSLGFFFFGYMPSECRYSAI